MTLDKNEWNCICETCSLEFLEEHEKDLDWCSAIKNPNITSELIKKNRDKIHNNFYDFETCSLLILEEFEDTFDEYEDYHHNPICTRDFYWISQNSNLSINFIRRHEDEFDWYEISKWATLEILNEFEDRIHFWDASSNPNLSLDLIKRNIDGIYWFEIAKWATDDIYEGFKNELEYYELIAML